MRSNGGQHGKKEAKHIYIRTITKNADNNVHDERLEDTLVDMACYCLMTLYELKTTENRAVSYVKKIPKSI